MRTRFLTADYFTPNQTLEFLRLPLSPLPSSLNHQLSSSFDNLLRFCDDFSDTSVSLQLESLPIDDALSKFYSDVLPDTIDADYGDVQVSEKDTDIYYENKAAQNCLASGSETLESRFAGERSKDAVGDKNGNEAVIIQFETPELTQHLENIYMPDKEEFQLLPEVQECDNYLETLNLVPTDPCAFDIIDQVNSAESICLDYDMTLKSQLSDEADLLPNNILPCGTLPLLEVEEVEPSVCLEDEWHSLFDAIEEQHSACDIDLELCCKDLLVSVDIDIVEQISDSHLSKLPFEFCIPSLNLVLDIDLLQVIETPYIEKNTESVGAYPIPLVNPFLFEEIMMLAPASLDNFEVQAICQATDETELCNMFHGDTPSESFGELIVSCELAIINDTFTSLSVPDLVDDEKIWSLHAIIDNILTELEPLPLSTSDDIYLDWHLLGRGEYSDDVSAVIEKVFNDIETYTTGSSLTFDDDSMQVSDLLLSDDTSVVLNIRESKVTMPSEVCSTVKLQNDEVASRELPDEECQVIENIRDLTNDDFEKLASGKSSDDDDDCQIIENDGICDGDFHKLVPSVDSMPQFNDLDFFLNPKKATGGMRTGHKVNPLDAKSLLSRGTLQKAIASSSTIQMQQLDIQWHTLILPANINFLIDNFRRSYLKILRDDVQLSNTGFPMTNSNDMKLLKLSEEKLMDHLSKSSQPKSFTGHVDDSCFDFVALCAIKRMTWCLCFFGIYSLRHLICKLFQGQDTLKSRLSFLYPVIEDAYRVVDKEVTKSHPSLATIKDLLLQNDTRNGKVLILAQQVLWEPLKRLLTSMGLSFSEVDYSMHDNQPNPDYNFFAGLKDRIQTKCLLAPHECISSSILMQKFDIIVEYGGPCGFSKLSAHSREYIGPQTLHFLKVELDDVAKAMCEGVVCSSDNSDAVNLEALLHFGPIKERCYQVPFKTSGGTKSCSMAVPVCGIAQESEQGHPLSFQDMPIIVNTQNFDKEMIISRRSTYQKVLNMEKRGVQVVERDLILRVDMILNTTTCLVWYDCNNIGKKATAEDEGASSVPLCIENIANVLTSLSFVFTTCILIFEGDCNFHGSVMESADELYAAAASLGTYLQIFYSSSLELTDEIILNYIGHCKNTNKGSLSTLPDSETLAESFLSKFPSMNPLSAHAIVSSVGKLLDFFEMTVESRAHILREYQVSDESINLFTALCKYGEREESKSGVTDCSSSVSSPPDSGNFACRINSEDRKRKYIASSSDADFKWSGPSKKCVDDRLTEQGMLRPSDSKVCKSPGVCLQEKLPDFMLDEELFFEGDVLDTAIHMDTSNAWGEKNITEEPKVPTMEDIFAQSTLLVNDGISSQHKSGQHKSGTANNKYDESSRVILQDLHKDFVGEAVDFYDKSLFDEDFQIDEESIKHSPMFSETAKYASRYNRTARKLSFGNDYDQNIPLADEMNISCILDDNQQWRGDSDFNSVKYNWSNINSKAQERQGQPGRSMLENSMQNFKAQERQEQPGRSMLENSMQNFSDQFSKGKNASHYGETPLSKAVHSEQLQQGSPWTIEFLNRIKEKRKLRQHYPPYASVLRTGYQGNVTKATTRRSPTILEYFKYQSGSTPRKVAGQKTQKKLDQLRSEKNPSEFRPICTPIDKRARRSLSFATGGTGSQTKLVWGDKNTCSQDNRFPSRVMR